MSNPTHTIPQGALVYIETGGQPVRIALASAETCAIIDAANGFSLVVTADGSEMRVRTGLLVALDAPEPAPKASKPGLTMTQEMAVHGARRSRGEQIAADLERHYRNANAQEATRQQLDASVDAYAAEVAVEVEDDEADAVIELHVDAGSVVQWRLAARSLLDVAGSLFGEVAPVALAWVKAHLGARTSLDMTPDKCREARRMLVGLARSGEEIPALPVLQYSHLLGPFRDVKDAADWGVAQVPNPFRAYIHAKNAFLKFDRESGKSGAELGWAWVGEVARRQAEMMADASKQETA